MADDRTPASTDSLLGAGREILREELGWKSIAFVQDADMATSAVLSSIRTREVVLRAKLSPGSFYRRWKHTGTYLVDLCRYILQGARSDRPYLTRALDTFDKAASETQSIPDIVRAVTGSDLDVTSNSVDFAVQMFLWSLCRRYPILRELLASQYSEVDREWATKYSVTLGLLGWQLRPDVSFETFTALLTALSDGMAIRSVLDPALATAEAFALGVMAIIAATVDWEKSSYTLEAWLSGLSTR